MHTPVPDRPAAAAESLDSSALTILGDRARQVEELVGRFRTEPASLLTVLVELSRRLGFLPGPVLDYVGRAFEIPREQLDALVAFHPLLEARPPLAHRLGICANAACAARGGNEVERILREKGLPFGQPVCQGACDLGPIATYNHGAPLPISAARSRSLAKADPDDWEDVLSVEKPVHAFRTEPVVAFANIFSKNSHQLATARRHGVYASVEQALKAPAEAVLEAVAESGLVDCGRAGQPVGPGWMALQASRGEPRYLVVDACEANPGTFKDRIILERDPHLLIAGVVLAAYATGASEVFCCVRGEYELGIERLRTAVEEATRTGLLGSDILGSGLHLRMHVRISGGGYAAGGGRGLVAGLEGRLPQPGGQAPQLAVPALFGRPTRIENVETLALVPAIVAHGAAWYRKLGVGAAAGMKIFSLGGDVKRPGNYELPRGTPLRRLVEVLGGGPAQGKDILALLVGGAATPLLPPEALDLPLSNEALGTLGAAVGTGAVVVITEKSCLFDVARREIAFFARDSSAACHACRKRARAAVDAMDQLGNDRQAAEERLDALLAEASEAKACGDEPILSPLSSLRARFPEAAEQHFMGDCPCAPRRGRKT